MGVYSMEKTMVSIIIPVYNAEKYLRQCIDSLLKQTYSYFELICVDDGSTDSSFEMLKEYEKQDNRIRIVRQKNQYAGVARNNGMEQAKGKYLLFLDADDFFEENMLEYLINTAEKGETEVLVFNTFQYDNASNQVINTAWNPLKRDLFGEGIKSAEDIADVIFEFTTPAPWNKLFLREFVEKKCIRFQNLQRTNDLYFVFTALSCAQKIGILDKKLLYYRDNNVHSLQGSGEETPTIFAEALLALKNGLESRGDWDRFQKSYVNMALSICLYNLNNMKSIKTYNTLFDALRYTILPDLGLDIGIVDDELRKNICDKKSIIVYGAGTIARTLTRFLISICGYDKNKIFIVVTNISNNIDNICEIEVQSIDNLSNERKQDLIVVAVAEEKMQKEIKKEIISRGFGRSIALDFRGMAALIRGNFMG